MTPTRPRPPSAPAAPFLIAAVTGRALAASAGRGGHRVVVLDFFADRDTRAFSYAAAVVARPGSLRFDRRALLAAAQRLAPPAASAGVVPGSGFEARPELLAELAQGRTLLGNGAETVTLCKDPARFLPLLRQLGIPHPEVRLAPVPDPRGWLEKAVGGAGGHHVRPATRRAPRKGHYLERRHPGEPCSATFLANGSRALVLGFNTQWTDGTSERPYTYAGAVTRDLPDSLALAISTALDRLVAATGLVGLGSLDFLLDGRDWWTLEVNPRPTATFELYDPDYPKGLFDAHLAACKGVLPACAAPRAAHRAHLIVTAPCTWHVPQRFAFPEWCHDLPMPGTVIPAMMPLCTVTAEAPTDGAAGHLARERRESLLATLEAEALAGA
jgi:predicted ATP-grasp superfamily ATP-dependent carboligase